MKGLHSIFAFLSQNSHWLYLSEQARSDLTVAINDYLKVGAEGSI